MYRTNFGIGHSMKEILDAHRPPGGRLGAGHMVYMKHYKFITHAIRS